MPFQKATPPHTSELHDLAHGWGKIIARRAFGDDGPDLDADFDSLEQAAVDAARAITQGTLEEALRRQREKLGDSQPCPDCGQACPVSTRARPVQVRGATITYDEPVCHCPSCRRDFFPSPPPLEA
jgi:hypothetical protein